MPSCKGFVGDAYVSVLRGTGCSGVIVRKGLVDRKSFTGEVQKCVLADGTQIEVPVADVQVNTPFYTGKVTAWCMEKPMYNVILGNIPDASFQIQNGKTKLKLYRQDSR